MKKIDEMLQELNSKKEEVRGLLNDNKVEDAETKMTEIRALEKKIEIQKQLDEAEERELDTKIEKGKVDNMDNKNEIRYAEVFCKYLRNMALAEDERRPFTEEEKRALSSNRDEDGKLLIPQDITTKIKELKRNYLDMYDYVNVEPVGTATGSRVIEQDAAHVPFEGVAELVSIPDMGSPKFSKVSFAINDFKGLIEIPNSLLKDESADLMGYLAKWITKKMVATHNALIFYADGSKAQGILGVTTDGFTIDNTFTTPALVKDFKTIFNKKLPQAIAKTSKIFTNQSGFDYLDSLEDKNGHPYLQPDVTNPTQYKFLGKEVVVFDDAVLKNNAEGKAPFVIGNTVEAVTYFDREKLSVASSTEAGFDNDATKVRAITRGDVKFVDKKAIYVLFTPVA